MPENNRLFNAMMALLRAGLWQDAAVPADVASSGACVAHFPLSPDEWKALYALACEQAVVGVVWQGISSLPVQYMPPQAVVARWVAHVDAIERRNVAMDKALASLLGLYRANGIEPVILKGHTAAVNYPSPLLRQSGDIDIYFPSQAQRLKAEEILKDSGLEPVASADGSTVFGWCGVTVEHHSTLFDLQHPRSRKIVEPILARIENLCISLRLNNELTVNALAPYPNMLLLSTHVLKHALGRGVGLRQLCDVAVALNASRRNIDGREAWELFASLGLERWSLLLHSFLVQWLGLPPEALPWNDGKAVDTAPLMRIVQRGGNFGQYAGNGAPKGAVARKLGTAFSFLRNLGFCAKYAPGEAFYTFWQLLKGQCRRQ